MQHGRQFWVGAAGTLVVALSAVSLSACLKLPGSKPGSDSQFPQAFQAGYTVQGPQKAWEHDPFQFKTRHLYSDGKGKLRDESLDSKTGKLRIRVIDLTNNQVLCWDEGPGADQHFDRTKIIMTGSVPSLAAVPTFYDSKARKAFDSRKSLGEKRIQGHPCAGYGEVTSSFGGLAPMSSPGPIWIDIEPAFYGVLVEDESDVHTTMQSFSNNTPADSLFKAPPNYLPRQ